MDNNALTYKIIVLDDNAFFNSLLTKLLKNFTHDIYGSKKYQFEIQSYTSYHDCIRNLDASTNVIFSDYFLGNRKTALHLLEEVKTKCMNCKVVVLSGALSISNTTLLLAKGAVDFVFKDKNSLQKSCYILEGIIEDSI